MTDILKVASAAIGVVRSAKRLRKGISERSIPNEYLPNYVKSVTVGIDTLRGLLLKLPKDGTHAAGIASLQLASFSIELLALDSIGDVRHLSRPKARELDSALGKLIDYTTNLFTIQRAPHENATRTSPSDHA